LFEATKIFDLYSEYEEESTYKEEYVVDEFYEEYYEERERVISEEDLEELIEEGDALKIIRIVINLNFRLPHSSVRRNPKHLGEFYDVVGTTELIILGPVYCFDARIVTYCITLHRIYLAGVIDEYEFINSIKTVFSVCAQETRVSLKWKGRCTIELSGAITFEGEVEASLLWRRYDLSIGTDDVKIRGKPFYLIPPETLDKFGLD